MKEKVLFTGFKPNSELISAAKKWIWSIEEQSPSKSTQSAMITKTASGFEGYLKVNSVVGHFEVFANAPIAENIFKELKSKMTSKLTVWKKSRDSKDS